MKQYKLLNNVVGWIVFAFALFVFGSTIESSASFWDCGEFVPASLKLQVVHPPGAPLFLMIGRMFTLLAGNDLTKVPVMVNMMSAISSAFAVLFLFWTTTMLAKKVMIKTEEDYTLYTKIAIMGTGLIAATCGTFTDSFWFSAVEGEVYALSSFFLMLVIWATFKWDASEDKYADRWLIFIGYSVGLSLGVHLLSLLALPVLGVVYYFKKYKFKWLHFGIAFAASMASVPFVMKFIISGIPASAAFFDKFFVNSLSMPFYSGAYFYIVFTIAVFVGLYLYTRKKGYAILNTVVLALGFLFIGYSSYIMVPIRSIANTPINMNKPQDPYRLLSYLNREQYGDRPLSYGPQYTVDNYDIDRVDDDGEVTYKNKLTGKYEVVDKKYKYIWKEGTEVIFPRMGVLMDAEKTNAYRGWFSKWDMASYNVVDRAQNNEVVENYATLNEAQRSADDQNKGGQPRFAVKDNISQKHNLTFFINYQIGFMYFRYLMWNFSGRQNDMQGLYYNDDGRWITGIDFLDKSVLKMFGTPQSNESEILPDKQNNWGHNVFFGIPFILGLIGAFYLFRKNPTVFGFILLFWFLTGIVQIVGLNQPPREPRERDYIFAGSVLAYSIFIGFAVLFIAEEVRKRMKDSPIPAALAVALCLVAPFLMGSQGWDDHDRSNRYVARDMAVDYLESCAPNAILFTQGDNDTYPLWYAQEVENIRPDIRIINLSLLGVDWYIDQLHFKLNDGHVIKTSFTWDQIKASNRNVVRYKPNPALDANTYYSLKDIMKFVASEKPADKTVGQNGESEAYFPTTKVYLPVDSAKIASLNILAKEDLPYMVKGNLNWDIPPTIMKDKLMILDIIANNLWDRPIYFAVSCSADMYVGLDKYIQLEGMANRLVPKMNTDPRGSIYDAPLRTDVMYDRMMNKYKWGNMKDPKVYLDENILRMTYNIRSNFGRLAKTFADKGQNDKALKLLNKAMTELPTARVPLNIYNMIIPEAYYKAGDKTNGKKYAEELVAYAKSYLDYYDKQGESIENDEVQRNLYILNNMSNIMKAGGDVEASKKVDAILAKMNQRFPQPQQQMMPQ